MRRISQHLDFDFCPPELWENIFLLFPATQFMVICYGSPWKRIQPRKFFCLKIIRLDRNQSKRAASLGPFCRVPMVLTRDQRYKVFKKMSKVNCTVWRKILINRERTAVYLKTVVANPDYKYKTPGLITITTIIITAMMVAVSMGACVPSSGSDSESGLKPLALPPGPDQTHPRSCKQSTLSCYCLRHIEKIGWVHSVLSWETLLYAPKIWGGWE